MIRKPLSVFFILCMLSVCCVALFCSCGSGSVTRSAQEPSPSPTGEPFSRPEPDFSQAADEIPPDLPPVPVDEADPDSENGREIALSLIGQDVSLLYEALGEPISAEYSLSCNGPGDDGLLTYDGFIVFTYREDGVETVFDVM